MTVIGTANEINAVLQCISPGFPRQNLESIGSGECRYIMNGTEVVIFIAREETENG